jgi:hypothetical protein
MRLFTLLVIIAATIMTTLADGETEMSSRTLCKLKSRVVGLM